MRFTAGTGRRGRRPWLELAELDYFRDVPVERLKVLRRHADRIEVRAGTTLQRAGHRVSWVWVPVHGALALRRDGHVLAPVFPGDSWGESEVLLHLPAQVDLVAATDATVLSVPAPAFEALLATPEFGGSVARRLARRAVVPDLARVALAV